MRERLEPSVPGVPSDIEGFATEGDPLDAFRTDIPELHPGPVLSSSNVAVAQHNAQTADLFQKSAIVVAAQRYASACAAYLRAKTDIVTHQERLQKAIAVESEALWKQAEAKKNLSQLISEEGNATSAEGSKAA